MVLAVVCLAVLLPIAGHPAVLYLFPVPVSDATTPFAEVDDAAMEVPFTLGFSFEFYGNTYQSVFLNTNGGSPSGPAVPTATWRQRKVGLPGIAVFLGGYERQASSPQGAADDLIRSFPPDSSSPTPRFRTTMWLNGTTRPP